MTVTSQTDDAQEPTPAAAEPTPRGGLLIEAFSYVRGWITGLPPAASQTVTLLLNGEFFWNGAAERLEHAEFDETNSRTPCGIWVPLPAPSTRPYAVRISLVAGDHVLASAEADLSMRFRGFLDKVESGRYGLFIEGWVHDMSRPLDPVKIEIRKSGIPLRTLPASKSRQDLAQDKIGLGNHAFSELVPYPERDTRTDDVEVAIEGTTITLAESDTLLQAKSASQNLTGAAEPEKNGAPALAIELSETSIKSPESAIAGVCDKITNEEVLGWAVNLLDKEEPVVLDLLINNFVVATTRTDRFRADIGKKFEFSGFAGFHFEIIPQMRLGNVLNIAVVPRKTGAVLPHGHKTIGPAFTKYLPANPVKRGKPGPAGSSRTTRSVDGEALTPLESAPSVALIVLNRNGAAVLDQHFESFWEHNTYRNAEHVVVDHASTDASRQVAERWKARGLKIQFVERNCNYSFSASNNFALAYTDADYLIFCNNDIFFTKDVLPQFMRVLTGTGGGIAGIKLLDESNSESISAPEFAPPTIQHLGVFYNLQKYDRVVHPVEARYLPILQPRLDTDFEVPAVTGAFLGLSRKTFIEAGGFYEGYFYGYEDIDLCLTVKLRLQRSIMLAGSTDALHVRGHSRKKTGLWGGAAMLRNSGLLSSRFGLATRRLLRRSLLRDYQDWTATRPIIAFAVSEAKATTTAGDFYTAYELALELSERVDATIVFLEENQNWYDVREIDLLVAMTHNYDLSLMEKPKQNLITIGWARNWFSEWAKQRDHDFDLFFSSSPKGASTIEKGTGHPEHLLRIATNPNRFFSGTNDEKTVDYVFTGSFWGHARDLIYFLEPQALPFTCEIYGGGWEQIPHLAPYAKGFASYDQLAGIYRRARVVIDDANSVTKEWGSINSRVFDAISSGALVITNSPEASKDGFDGELPYFEGREQLEALLRKYCGSEEARLAKLATLQAMVRERHNYSQRADQFIHTVEGFLQSMLRIAIKVPCPSSAESHLWGDYHFAHSLARELRRLGHSVRVDLLDGWSSVNSLRDDAVICLRGLSQYLPTPDQINICWLISHPDTASIAELRKYDRVYVASDDCQWLKGQGLDNVETLLQCVDTDLFCPENFGQRGTGFDVLFIGNSRNQMRKVVKDALAISAPLTIIGSGWDGMVPPECVLQNSVPCTELPRLYSSARVVLNDHWESMALHGFLSNRLFDCVAAGAYVISDPVQGISEVFGPLVHQYRSLVELERLIDLGLKSTAQLPQDRQIAQSVCAANSFRVRAKTISDFLNDNYDAICKRRSVSNAESYATLSVAAETVDEATGISM
jgi:GT2 family glycosyltransferase